MSVNRQLKLLQVPRSSYYYKPTRSTAKVVSDERVKDDLIITEKNDAVKWHRGQNSYTDGGVVKYGIYTVLTSLIKNTELQWFWGKY